MSHVVIGICPVCEREMWQGASVDKHHFMPKCRGGKETLYVHKVCHRKIHSLWTEKELEKEFNDPASVRLHPEIKKFVSWISKKELDFYDRSENHRRKKR